jgi:hypothetical protein
LRLLGWPRRLFIGHGIKVSDMTSLIGEALHLAVIGSVLYSAYAIPSAPWWSEVSGGTSQSGVQQQAPIVPGEPATKRHKRRLW